jgi:hypothetical protein
LSALVTRPPMSDLSMAAPRSLRSRWLASAVAALDARLRRLGSVEEYTRDPRCIFRIQVDRLDCTVMLSDGTWLNAGERVINLHLWNEQIPPFGADGASLTWASRLTRCVEISLRELCRFLSVTPELSNVVAICANVALGTRRDTTQLILMAHRFGFLAVQMPRCSLTERVHRIGENILISLLILVHNVQALRRDSLLRDRVRIVLRRSTLERRYRFSPLHAAAETRRSSLRSQHRQDPGSKPTATPNRQMIEHADTGPARRPQLIAGQPDE